MIWVVLRAYAGRPVAWLPVGERTFLHLALFQNGLFLTVCGAYASLEVRAGRDLTTQDVVDLLVGFVPYCFLFLGASLLLAFAWVRHPAWAYLPGVYQILYGLSLILRRPWVDAERLLR